MVYRVYSLELPRWDNSNEYRQHTMHDKIGKFPLLSVYLSSQKNFLGTKKWVRTSHGKRAIAVRSFWGSTYLVFAVCLQNCWLQCNIPVTIRDPVWEPMLMCKMIWDATSENIPLHMCAKQRFRSACAFVQSHQNFHWAHFGQPRMQQSFFMRPIKTLFWLYQCAGWFESLLGAHF